MFKKLKEKDVVLTLVGITAIIAIVGLVLLLSGPVTGQASRSTVLAIPFPEGKGAPGAVPQPAPTPQPVAPDTAVPPGRPTPIPPTVAPDTSVVPEPTPSAPPPEPAPAPRRVAPDTAVSPGGPRQPAVLPPPVTPPRPRPRARRPRPSYEEWCRVPWAYISVSTIWGYKIYINNVLVGYTSVNVAVPPYQFYVVRICSPDGGCWEHRHHIAGACSLWKIS